MKRQTPITDEYIGDGNDDNMTEGEIAMCEFARNLERQLAERTDERDALAEALRAILSGYDTAAEIAVIHPDDLEKAESALAKIAHP